MCLGVNGGDGYDWSSLIFSSGEWGDSTVISPVEGNVDAYMLVIRHVVRQPLVH